MSKTQDEFLDHFARLGVFSKVQALIDIENENETIKTTNATITAVSVSTSDEQTPTTVCGSVASGQQTTQTGTYFQKRKNFNFIKLKWICFILVDDAVEDAKEILQGKAYHWHEWSVCRGRDCLYVWSDSAALELSNGSNGWFRFILDGKLATMYSSGSPENGNDSSGMFIF